MQIEQQYGAVDTSHHYDKDLNVSGMLLTSEIPLQDDGNYRSQNASSFAKAMNNFDVKNYA